MPMIPRKSWAPWFAGHKARVHDRRFRVAMADEQREASRRLAERWRAEKAARDWPPVVEKRCEPGEVVEVPNPPTPAPSRALILAIITVILAVIAITIWKAQT